MRATSSALLAAAAFLAAVGLASMVVGLDDGVPESLFVPLEAGAVALECAFRPDGVIAECRRVGVAGEVLRP